MENKTVKQIWICVQHDFFISRKYGWLCREGGGTSTVTFAWQLQKRNLIQTGNMAKTRGGGGRIYGANEINSHQETKLDITS